MKSNAKNNTGRYARKSAKPFVYILLIFLVIAVLTGSLVMAYLHLGRSLEGNAIMDNVYVAGVNVGGMTKNEAIKAVRHATAGTYTQKSMNVQVLDHSISLNPGLTGACLNVNAAIELAYQYGRSDSQTQNAKQHLQALAGPIYVDILPCLKLNETAIRTQLQELTAHFSTTLTQPSYRIEGTAGNDQTLILTIGTPSYDLDLEDLYQKVLAAYNANVFSVDYVCGHTEPDPIDLDRIYSQTYTEPVDSVIAPETHKATAHSYGYHFDLESAKAILANAEYGQSFSVPYICTAPEITQEALDGLLFRDPLATYTAKASSSANRDINLRLACEAVNGLVIPVGDTFDYNKALGKRTAEKGYRYAPSYYGNQTIHSIGGGICQVSSTIYYCALTSDLEITTRINHGFLNTYVPMGMDATVSWGGPEFSFRNNMEYPIRIEASAKGGEVTITLWGTDTRDYYVKMDYTVLETRNYQVVEQEMPENNPQNYRDGDVIITPYTGYKVVTYRCKYDKQTNTLISKTEEAVSVYNKRDKVVCKIVPEETIPPTEETTPPAEETPSTEPSSPVISGPVTEDG